jgi:formate C-acetyltransferase
LRKKYADKLDELVQKESDTVRRKELEQMAAICRHVRSILPRLTMKHYRACFSSHIAICLETFENAISPGRLDQILYPYYQKDREAGIIDYEKARELLALFILKNG